MGIFDDLLGEKPKFRLVPISLMVDSNLLTKFDEAVRLLHYSTRTQAITEYMRQVVKEVEGNEPRRD